MFFALTEQGMDLWPYIEKIWLGTQVIFGIGLMIIIHELGHFIAAKKIGVRVETFSLGFGPRLLGFRRGDTDYRLSAIPLGGYVKMAGENPEDPKTGAADELQNRKPWERMVIFSAGVFMNLLFAFITIPILFAVGVPFVKPEVGFVTPGGPAWRAGIQPGDRILEVNGNTIYEFNDIPLNIALGNRDFNNLLVERNEKVLNIPVAPEMNEQEGRYQILITSPTRYVVTVEHNSPAYEAGLRTGDRIVSINGAPPGEWWTEGGASRFDPLRLEVIQKESDESQVIEIAPEIVQPSGDKIIGIQPRVNRVHAFRGALADGPREIMKGDELLEINGTGIYGPGDVGQAIEAASYDSPIQIRLLREGELREIVLDPSSRKSLLEDMAVSANLESNSVRILRGGALDDLMDPNVQDGMRILAVNGENTSSFLEISQTVREAEGDRFELRVAPPAGEGEARTVAVTSKPVQEPWIGFNFLPDLQTRRLNLPQAIKAGFQCSLYMVKTCYLTLSRILTGDVGSKNLGGIITISRASYTFAELGFARLFFFLAILSINLGFLNILPIPVLDGGHLLFLLIEKIKGSPVNEKILGYSQIVGLVFILALLIYVTYNDILRWIY